MNQSRSHNDYSDISAAFDKHSVKFFRQRNWNCGGIIVIVKKQAETRNNACRSRYKVAENRHFAMKRRNQLENACNECDYAKDKNENTIYDEFNIDPHTFSAIWYALDTYEVADVKYIPRNSKRGAR